MILTQQMRVQPMGLLREPKQDVNTTRRVTRDEEKKTDSAIPLFPVYTGIR